MSAPALSLGEHLRFLRQVWRPNRWFLVPLVGLTAVSTAITIAYPLVFRAVIDSLAAGTGSASLGHLFLVLGLIALGRLVAGFYPSVRSWINLRVEMAVRARVFESILGKDHTFFGRFRTGDLVTRLTDDITDYPRISWFACSGIFRFVDSASRFVFCIATMLVLDVPLALLALLPVPAMLYVFYRVRHALGTIYEQQQEAVARTNDALEAAFSGVKIVKAFNAGPGQERHLGEVLRGRIAIQLRLTRLHALVQQLDDAAGRIGQIVVLVVGGLRVMDGTLSLGTLYAIYLYLEQLIRPMVDLPNLLVAGRQAFVSIDREEEVLRHPGVVRRTGTLPGPARIDAVRLEGVHFTYRPDRAPALQDVSFDVAAGARVAVVGPVGCGKTTLLQLLAGLLPPERGALLVNGQPHGAWTWPGLRSRIGYVPQDARLFSDTVLDNVSFGREVGEAQVRACLRIAQVADEVDAMPQGLATRLGRGGARVSGGQRQRIAIARALAGRPDLLLLDDCTASLDAENEERFWRALGEERPGLTVIVVSHRLATIRRADTILVLEAGRLVDRGGHEDLAGRCATYKSFLLTEEVRRHLQAVGTPG